MPNPPVVVVGVPVRGQPPLQAALVVPTGVQHASNPPPTSAGHRPNHQMLHITETPLGADEAVAEQKVGQQASPLLDTLQ